MKRMITLLLALAMCIGMLPVAAFAQTMPFTDVDGDAFYYDAVAWAVEDGITEGMTRTTFGPDVNCTRGHVVTFLWRLAGCPAPEGDTMPFVDVELNEYYTDAILWAVEQGITEGRDDTHFDPQAECSRAEIAVFLWRFFGSQSVEGLTNPFADVVSGEWYTSAIIWAADQAITKGMPDQTFAFADTCTRGQVVTFLYRAAKLMEDLEEPTVPSEEPTEPSEGDEPGLTLKEDATTVTSGEMLRASTYALTSANSGTSTQATTTKTLKYFDVTLFDYDMATINTATGKKEADNSGEKKGIYFSDGSAGRTYGLGTEEKRYQVVTTESIETGSYLISCGNYYLDGSYNDGSSWGTRALTSTQNQANAGIWTITKVDGGYTIQTNDGKYLAIGENSADLVTKEHVFKIAEKSNGSFSIQDTTVEDNNNYLNNLGGSNVFGGWKDDSSDFTLTRVTITTGYAEYNYWAKLSGANFNGQKFYTGLVQDKLVDGNIVFNEPEGGIFNSDSSVKTIYNNVEMPFVYDESDRSYTFDSSSYGVYFHSDNEQNSTAANETEKKLRLYFNQDTRQTGNTYGDGSKYHWLPFNDATEVTPDSAKNYHFGMVARIPFTMTTNGRLKEGDDTSAPITFEFSGDDDVWVFIDDQLVIDLGGIHNRLNATINFATGEVTYSKGNDLAIDTGSFNNEEFALTQNLYEDLISDDRTAFAANDEHTLSVFYLERGMGASNCKIKFNLPMKDSLTVTKKAEHNWDGNTASALTPADQAKVDAMDFTFTLYKSEDSGNKYTPMSKASYILLNADGSVNSKLVTNENGQFTLKNGQSAKFITEFEDNICFYVQETGLNEDIFWTPDFSYSGTATNGFSYKINGTEETWTPVTGNASLIKDKEISKDAYEDCSSHRITVKGSKEAADNLNIICRNFVKNDLPNPSVRPTPDKLVIDYGLRVEIPVEDILANDFFNGNELELVAVSGNGMTINGEKKAHNTSNGSTIDAYDTEPTAINGNNPEFGAVTLSEDGKTIIYTLNEQMTGVEVLNYMVRTHDNANQVSGKVTLYDAAIAQIYIIPATTMYYEEDFTGLVTYGGKTDVTWEPTGEATNSKQETGLVDSTKKWSPYGSDVAYQDDKGDSNGTSRYVDTTSGSATFSYTFTGTGTSFFARTSKDTGYLRIVVTDAANKTVDYRYRDTAWLSNDDEYAGKTLYNIPVYTLEDLDYSTYMVTVTVARQSDKLNIGKDFWLDGIRIINPLNKQKDENLTAIALDAYHQDGESDMQSITLRNKLLTTDEITGEYSWSDSGNFVVFTDSNGKIQSAEEYQSIGPKEEVYLNVGQLVSFSVITPELTGYKLFLGMKAPFGSAKVTVGNQEYELSHAADCYYNVTGNRAVTQNSDGTYTCTYTIEATDSVVSLTNIKVTDSSDIVLNPTKDIQIPGDSGGDVNGD